MGSSFSEVSGLPQDNFLISSIKEVNELLTARTPFDVVTNKIFDFQVILLDPFNYFISELKVKVFRRGS